MPVRVSVRGRSLGPEHAAQHGQSLHVADVAVVVQPGQEDSHWWVGVCSSCRGGGARFCSTCRGGGARFCSSCAPPAEGEESDSQRLQKVAPKRVSGPGGLGVRVRVWAQVLAGGCGGQGPDLSHVPAAHR